MPSNLNKRAVLGILAGLSVVVVLYSLIIVQQILLGLIVAVVPWLLYLFVRFVFILERIASALQRLATAHAREQESTGSAGDYQRPSESYQRGTETEGGVEDE
jgi:CBS domain containing-hemolysin-like protein